MTQQTEAQRLADELERRFPKSGKNAAAELRRLDAVNAQLLETLKDIAYQLEKARIWGRYGLALQPVAPNALSSGKGQSPRRNRCGKGGSMKRDDIIRLYKEANGWNPEEFDRTVQELERFAALVRADEREACAALVDENAMGCENPIYRSLLQANAEAIRTRGEA